MKKLLTLVSILLVSSLAFGSNSSLEHRINQELIRRNIGDIAALERDFEVQRQVDIERNRIDVEIEIEERNRPLTNEERARLSDPAVASEMASVVRSESGSQLPIRIEIKHDPRRGRDEILVKKTFR